MQLWQLIIKENKLVILWLLIISTLSAFAGIGIIAYINQSLTQTSDVPLRVLAQFIGLLILYFILRFASQFSLTYMGNNFLFDYLNKLIKRVIGTDIAVIEKIGSSKVLASISKDIDKVHDAFMAIPTFIQSIVISLTAIGYLGYLSINLLIVVLVILTFMLAIGSLIVKQVYKQFGMCREAEDGVYKSYETILYGRKELSLNRHRAKLIYENDYKKYSSKIRRHSIKGQTLHFIALNWADVMMLGSIGIVFFLANSYHLADNTTAMTFAVTILFLKAPLMSGFVTIPDLLEAQVSFDKINSLTLTEEINNVFELKAIDPNWSTIDFKEISYEYVNEKNEPTFGIGAIDFTINRGEVIFLIGGNGSGKSTFAKIVTGLYKPTSGNIFVDDLRIDEENNHTYRQYFSAVFTDLYLFKTIIGQEDTLTHDDMLLMKEWLDILQMTNKLDIEEGTGIVLNDDLSQGQKKRLAMLLAVLEQRDLILLDEWAADQDPQFRRTFYNEIIPKLQAMGKTLIIISHDDHYFDNADRLLQMKNGKLIELTGDERVNASRDAIAIIS